MSAANIPAFVYEGAGCTGAAALSKYQAVLGRTVDGASDFLDDSSTWANLVVSTQWSASCWKGKVANIALAVPMGVVDGGTTQLADIAAGKDDVYYTQIGQTLVAEGFPGAYLRVGWEFNGNWYIWAASGHTAQWIAAFQHIVSVMRAVSGQSFKFVWNPGLGTESVSPALVYPGDAYVDVVGTDAYDNSWDVDYTVPARRWDSIDNDSWGVAAVIAFAKTHNKPVAFPEWAAGTRPDGHGGGDDPLYITNMAAAMAGTTVAYQSYWDFNAADFNGVVSGGQYPAALAALMNAFGSSSAGSASTVPIVKTIGAILKAYAAPYTAQPITVTATGCSEQTLQNAPDHYELIVWTATSGSCTLSWGAAATASSVRDPSLGVTPTRQLGPVTGATITLVANKPLIVAVQK